MPCYPALALLLGSAMAAGGNWIRYGTRVLCGIFVAAAAAVLTLYFLAWNLPTPGDISAALSSNPGAYKLSLGHMEDLTIASFAYLRLPLLVAAAAFLVGAAGTLSRYRAARVPGHRPDGGPVLSGRAHRHGGVRSVIFPRGRWRKLCCVRPPGKLIVDHHYYTFSSVFFYTNRDALLLNGRFNNLVYGSYAPGAPNVFHRRRAMENICGCSRSAAIW